MIFFSPPLVPVIQLAGSRALQKKAFLFSIVYD